jgi:hypothetical protein
VHWKPLPEPSGDELRDLQTLHKGKARLLFDENAGLEVTEFLKGRGFNAKFVADNQMTSEWPVI